MRLTDIGRAHELAKRLDNRKALRRRLEEGDLRVTIGSGSSAEELVLTPGFRAAIKKSALTSVQHEIDDATRELEGMGVNVPCVELGA